MEKEVIDTTMTGVGGATTYTGAGTIGLGWLLSSEAAVIYGLIVGLIGIMIQLFFGLRKDRRDAAAHRAEMREHEKRMALLDAGHLTRAEDLDGSCS